MANFTYGDINDLFKEPQEFSQQYCDNLPFDERLDYKAKNNEQWTRNDMKLFKEGVVDAYDKMQQSMVAKEQQIAELEADLSLSDYYKEQVENGNFDIEPYVKSEEDITYELSRVKYEQEDLQQNLFERVYKFERVDASKYPDDFFSNSLKDRDGQVHFVTSDLQDMLGSDYKEFCSDKFKEELSDKRNVHVHNDRPLPSGGEDMLNQLEQNSMDIGLDY